MKNVILAAVAATFVFASAVAGAAGTTAPAADAAAMTMTAEECAAEMAKCTDQACKDALVAKGCKAE